MKILRFSLKNSDQGRWQGECFQWDHEGLEENNWLLSLYFHKAPETSVSQDFPF